MRLGVKVDSNGKTHVLVSCRNMTSFSMTVMKRFCGLDASVFSDLNRFRKLLVAGFILQFAS